MLCCSGSSAWLLKDEPWKVAGNTLEQKGWGGVKEHDWGDLCSLCFSVPCLTLSSHGFSSLTSWYYGFHIEKYLADLRDQAKSNTSGIIPEPLGKATGDQLALLHWHFSPRYSILGIILPVWHFHTYIYSSRIYHSYCA